MSKTKLPIRQVPDVRHMLVNEHAREQIAQVAAASINPDRLIHLLINVTRRTPKLLECDPQSFLGAVMELAQLGLEPNTPLGHAWILPFQKSVKQTVDGRDRWVKTMEAQVVIGYLGMIELAYRSGRVASITAECVYDDDELFQWELGADPKLRHVPGPQNGKLTHAYAVMRSKDGHSAWLVLTRDQIIRRRDQSQNWQSAVKFGKTASSPWVTNEDSMWKKTAVRAFWKYLPRTPELQRAAEIDGRQVDYRSRALDPREPAAPVIDLSPTDYGDPAPESDLPVDDEGSGDEAEQPEPPAQEPRPRAAAPKREPKAAPPPPSDEPDEDRMSLDALAAQIIADMKEAGPVALMDVLEMHGESIEKLEAEREDLKAQVDEVFAEIAGARS